MSVEEHRKNATSEPIRFAVLVASSTRTLDDDRSGGRIVELVERAGHPVLGRHVVGDDMDAIRGAVGALETADVIVVTGGTGLAPSDVTPEALRPLFIRPIEGFGELFRSLSFEQIGAAAMLSRACAGVLPSGAIVFALPGSVRACELALERLILPEVGHLVSLVERIAHPPEAREAAPEAHVARTPAPPPSGRLGRLGGVVRAVSVHATPEPDGANEDGEASLAGWKRAVAEIRGEVLTNAREEVPQPIENLSPVVNVLETAGQVAVLKLPDGRRYGLYGWPDLQRPGSKVLAVGWGQPLVEVLALHRYPTSTGTCIDEPHGQLPRRTEPVGPVCETVTGRAPRDPSGQLFAVSGDAVWIERAGRVIKWDGRSERDEGNPKQVLATLLLEWHQR